MKSTVVKFTVAFSLAISAIFPLFAADWTGEDGNTYTALEYLQGNGNGYVLTDIVPSCTDTVKMYFKTPSPLTKLQALFCARGSGTKNSFVGCMDGGNDQKLRIDRNSTVARSPAKELVDSTQYLLEADFNNRVVKLNGAKCPSRLVQDHILLALPLCFLHFATTKKSPPIIEASIRYTILSFLIARAI